MSTGYNHHQNLPKRERVIVTPLGLLTVNVNSTSSSSSSSSPPTSLSVAGTSTNTRNTQWQSNWPSCEFLNTALEPYRHDLVLNQQHQHQEYWQVQARRALLQECGFLKAETTKSSSTDSLDRSETDENMAVQMMWDHVITLALQDITNHEDSVDFDNNSNDIDSGSGKRRGRTRLEDDNNLIDFFRNEGKSNHRQLEWALMDCAAGCQFHLHAHPNLELVYCIKGELHEVRLVEEDVDDDQEDEGRFRLVTEFEETGEITKNQNPQVIGPSLIGCTRPWRFGTLSQGRWLVNRVGTIHKSFTATKGDGCILLVLWGGSHANIPQEPHMVVQAVKTMDNKLDCSCRGGEWMTETFLPESEKRK